MPRSSEATSSTLAQDYAECFADLGKGKALYNPVSSTELRPGSLGFFDEDGDWHGICELTDEASMQKCSLTAPPKRISMKEDQHVEWREPLTSKGVQGRKISNQADMGSLGLPAQASMCYQYVSGTDFGACLVVSKDVVVQRSDLNDGEARAFADMNARVLWSKDRNSALGANLRKYGLCVIGKTWAVRKYTLTAWRGQGNAAHIGFNMGAQGVAGAQTDGVWLRGNSAGIWQSGEVDQTSERDRALGQPEKRLVVFASGIQLKPVRFKPTQSGPLRSGQLASELDLDVYPVGDDEAVEVQWQVFGRMHGPRQRGHGSDSESDSASSD